MDRLLEIEELLEDMAEMLEPHLELLPAILAKVKTFEKPLSVFSMTSFLAKIESIRIGIFEVAKIEEHYSMNILYRSIIEHFIKAQYIWLKSIELDNDEIGIDYWLFGKDQENIDYTKALHQSYTLLGITPTKSPLETLKELGVISNEKSASQIRKRTEQFAYKNMTHYIAESTKMKESGVAPILSSIFPRYSELSSCVHGGPDSVEAYRNGPDAMLEIIEMSTFASLYIRWLSFVLLYQYDESMNPLCQISQGFLHRFTENEGVGA
ncbi:hypothetical protein [Thiomicrorhabdus sp.]|uniref:hypothetical protein n=1 Tax=Thiomicrorhabdus sp. TaxID=2039724 RepID=UPI002AA821F9|nr:hypothetical protein [Thiomicrorhabdus sp.]